MEKTPVRLWIEEHRNEFIADMVNFFQIKSVSEPQQGIYPFGKGCKDMLDFALALSKKYGLRAENHENYCGSALLDGEIKEEIGIFTHIDVVEEGEGWRFPPYNPVIKNGWIYARGSSDNKGPAVACLYALRYLKEQRVPLKHTIRLYYGCSEEHGMEDIEYYKKHYALPKFSLVPDAKYAVCFAEKGILQGKLKRKLEGNLLLFEAGHADNAVPSSANAIIKIDSNNIKRVLFILNNIKGIHAETCSEGIKVCAVGRTAHAASPENGQSAAVKLAKVLSETGVLENASSDCLKYIYEAFKTFDGEGMGIACSGDITGPLTLVGGRVETTTKEKMLYVTLEIRYPANVDQQRLMQTVKDVATRYGFETMFLNNNASYQINSYDSKIRKVIDICNNVWECEFQPFGMSGGTYARKIPNAIACGAGILEQKKPGWPDRGYGHQPDECVCIENMMKTMDVYTQIIMEIDGMLMRF